MSVHVVDDTQKWDEVKKLATKTDEQKAALQKKRRARERGEDLDGDDLPIRPLKVCGFFRKNCADRNVKKFIKSLAPVAHQVRDVMIIVIFELNANAKMRSCYSAWGMAGENQYGFLTLNRDREVSDVKKVHFSSKQEIFKVAAKEREEILNEESARVEAARLKSLRDTAAARDEEQARMRALAERSAAEQRAHNEQLLALARAAVGHGHHVGRFPGSGGYGRFPMRGGGSRFPMRGGGGHRAHLGARRGRPGSNRGGR